MRKMKKIGFMAAGACAAAMMLGACASSKPEATAEPQLPGVIGKWAIVEVAQNPSSKLDVTSIKSDEPVVIIFENDTAFVAQTNCNSIMGNYKVSGDSASFSQMGSTRMMCPQMDLERSLSVVLPAVNAISFPTDSTAVFSTPAGGSVTLVRAE